MKGIFRSSLWSVLAGALWVLCATMSVTVRGADAPRHKSATISTLDPRIHTVLYNANRIYRLRGHPGYQIDIEFAPGERFTGAGVGDAKGITLAASANHLFIKPRAAHVATNLTVLTNERTYLFDYTVDPEPPGRDDPELTYELRFEYPGVRSKVDSIDSDRARVTADLSMARHRRPRNLDYWYGGAPSLKPRKAWDDGAEIHLVFGPRQIIPAVFVRNKDGGDSLVNFTVHGDVVIVQRVVRRLILRRGRLSGCVVDRDFSGSGRSLPSGTISSRVRRLVRKRP